MSKPDVGKIRNIYDKHGWKFRNYNLSESQQDRYELLCTRATVLLEDIIQYTPPSPEQSLAITKLEECIMWANKAITCNE